MDQGNRIQRMLVIGYGNRERGDDGVAFHVVNRLRERLGRRPLGQDDNGIDELGEDTAVFVPQLVPELALDAAAYDRLVLVDAHLPGDDRPVVALRLQPEFQPPSISHVLSPRMFLWLVQAVSGRSPRAFMVSVRGHCFDPARRLSPATAALVDPTAARVVKLIVSANEPPI